MSRRPWRAGHLAALAVCLGLGGCSTLGKLAGSVREAGASLLGRGKPQPAAPAWTSVTIVAAADANQNSPVALDLVFVQEATLLEVLRAMPAAKWFATRDDTQRSFPDGLRVLSLEVVPAQTVRLTDPAQLHQPALAVFAFAAYPPPGEHRERLLPAAGGYLLQLGARGFKGTEVPAHAPN